MRFNFRYIQFQTPSGKGYATVAIDWEKQDIADGQKVLNYKCAVSFCSPKDRFVKRLGREVSLDRLQNAMITGKSLCS